MNKWGIIPFLLILFFGCTQKPTEIELSWQISFFPLGAKIHFPERLSIQQVSAFNSDDALVAQIRFPTEPRVIETLYFEWQAGEVYRFEATLSSEQVNILTVQAPKSYSQGNLDIAIPYGTSSELSHPTSIQNQRKSLIPIGNDMTATIIVTNGNAPSNFTLQLCIPKTIEVTRIPENWKKITENEHVCFSTSGSFSVASEVWFHEMVLTTPDVLNGSPTQTDTYSISGTIQFTTTNGETWEQETSVQVKIVPISDIVDHISITSIDMPTDANGNVDQRQREDTIFHTRPLFSWFGKEQTDPFEPITFQTVRLMNHGDETIHVVVSSINRDLKTGKPVPFLSPPDAVNAGTNQSISFASLVGGELTPIALPIYFQSQSAKAGEYERDIVVKIWGSDTTILHEKRSLHIIVPNRHALFVSGLAIISSCIGLLVLLRFHRRFIIRFSTKQLIVIAIFGATIFVTVVVPSTLFLNFITAILGPFSVILTGLVNETVYYAILTALLFYIYGAPDEKKSRENGNNQVSTKGGVILLVSAVRLLLGAVTFGLFSPMTIIYTGTSILLLETGFILVRKRGLFAWAFGLAICDAIAVYVDFQLSILFYRLFYADWYIVLRILLEGFVYTFIGVLLGAKLGHGLWRVAE